MTKSQKIFYILYAAFLIFFIIMMLTSCGTTAKANRKKQWLEDRGYFKTDTFDRIDTIHGFSIDTVYKSDSIRTTDTLTINKNGVIVKTIVRWKDKVIEQTINKTDTVLHIRTIKQTVKETPKRTFKISFSLLLIGILIGFILQAYFTRK